MGNGGKRHVYKITSGYEARMDMGVSTEQWMSLYMTLVHGNDLFAMIHGAEGVIDDASED